MRPFDLEAEVHYGSADAEPMSIEEAQRRANTQDEDQNEDPYTSPEEDERLVRILGFDPDDWEDEDDDWDDDWWED